MTTSELPRSRGQAAWEVARVTAHPFAVTVGSDFGEEALRVAYDTFGSYDVLLRCVLQRACPEELFREALERLSEHDVTVVLANRRCPGWVVEEVLARADAGGEITVPSCPLTGDQWQLALDKRLRFGPEFQEPHTDSLVACAAAMLGGIADVAPRRVRRWMESRGRANALALSPGEAMLMTAVADVDDDELQAADTVLGGRESSVSHRLARLRIGRVTPAHAERIVLDDYAESFDVVGRFDVETQAAMVSNPTLPARAVCMFWTHTMLPRTHRNVLAGHPALRRSGGTSELLREIEQRDVAVRVRRLLLRAAAPVELDTLDGNQLAAFAALAPDWASTLGDLLAVVTV